MNLLREKGDAAPYSLCRLNDSEMNLLKPFFSFLCTYTHIHSLTLIVGFFFSPTSFAVVVSLRAGHA